MEGKTGQTLVYWFYSYALIYEEFKKYKIGAHECLLVCDRSLRAILSQKLLSHKREIWLEGYTI